MNLGEDKGIKPIDVVNTVAGAANFEKSTLTDVIKARQQVTNIKLDPGSAPTDPQKLADHKKLAGWRSPGHWTGADHAEKSLGSLLL